jgi:predicted dehydrogenase
VGLVSRTQGSRNRLSERLGGCYPLFAGYEEALGETRPDAVCISTYPDTHAQYAAAALEAGAHVFLEKPLATTLAEAEHLVALCRLRSRKLVVGYILQQHPAWNRFVEEVRELGKPLVMRMNLNQQSSGDEWRTHKNIMSSMSPVVDCGVHYVEVMCRMTQSRPVRVHAIGARLTDELPAGMVNYGQLQVTFEDGSVGWYEAGWGPMMSQTAFFIKDVIGPRGSVSIAAGQLTLRDSADVNSHTRTDSIFIHRAALDEQGRFAERDCVVEMKDEPDHDALCAREQAFFANAIREDLDLSEHWDSAVRSLRIVLAADESMRTGQAVNLD